MTVKTAGKLEAQGATWMLLMIVALAAMPELIDPRQLTALADRIGDERVRRGAQARVRLAVDAAGRPAGCEIVASDDAPRAQRFCAGLQRLAYHPAHDVAGAPIAAVIDYTMATTILTARRPPEAAPPPRVDFAVQVDRLPNGMASASADLLVETDEAGHVAYCDVARSAGAAALDRIACAQVTATAFAPGRDAARQPAAALRRVSFGFSTTVIAP